MADHELDTASPQVNVVSAQEPTRCGCPGMFNTISRQGSCPTCGVVGPDHQRAVREALAAGRHRLAADLGREEGRQTGFAAGVEEGRRQAIEAGLQWAAAR